MKRANEICLQPFDNKYRVSVSLHRTSVAVLCCWCYLLADSAKCTADRPLSSYPFILLSQLFTLILHCTSLSLLLARCSSVSALQFQAHLTFVQLQQLPAFKQSSLWRQYSYIRNSSRIWQLLKLYCVPVNFIHSFCCSSLLFFLKL
jgi:hypothetical protein